MPRLSVLLPVYNTEKFVGEAIQSILNQTFTDFELIIADDGSRDESRNIIDSYPDPRIIRKHNDINLGKTATVNNLYRFATGEFITIHDADDFSSKERFQKQIEEFDRNPALVMCGTSFVTINNKGRVIEENAMETDYAHILQNIKINSQFHGPTMMFRKTYSDQLGEIYRPYFNDNSEDTDLAYRLLDRGLAYNLPDNLYTYRVLVDSLCRKNVSARNRNLYRVVSFLGDQRSKQGTDALMEGKPETVDRFFEDFLESYKADPSKIHREAASYYMYWRFHRKAIAESFKAVSKRPSRIINWRTLFYCIRKSIF